MVSQCSAAMSLRRGGTCNDNFVANFVLSLAVKKFWRLLNILRSYRHKQNVLFFLNSHCTYITVINTVRALFTKISKPDKSISFHAASFINMTYLLICSTYVVYFQQTLSHNQTVLAQLCKCFRLFSFENHCARGSHHGLIR